MGTKSAACGKLTSDVEILNVSARGVWILAVAREYFASYEDFPWFKKATIGAILNVEMPHSGHLYWPDLDVDLALASLDAPEQFPLVAKTKRAKRR